MGSSKAMNFFMPLVANFSTNGGEFREPYEVKMRIGPVPVKITPAFTSKVKLSIQACVTFSLEKGVSFGYINKKMGG
jgi:hypothetical protein